MDVDGLKAMKWFDSGKQLGSVEGATFAVSKRCENRDQRGAVFREDDI